MKLLKRKVFSILLAFCVMSGFAGILFGCSPKNPVQISILTQQKLTVEIDNSVELQYLVTPVDCLVTFKIEDKSVFDVVQEDGKNYIKAVSVGVSHLAVSAVYKLRRESVEIEIVVVEKKPEEVNPPVPPTEDENKDDKDDNEGGDLKGDENSGDPSDVEKPLDAGDRISVECEFGGTVVDDCIVVNKRNAGFVFVLDKDFCVESWNIFAVAGELQTEISEQEIYMLPDLGVEEYFLNIEVTEIATNKKYIKVYRVMFLVV